MASSSPPPPPTPPLQRARSPACSPPITPSPPDITADAQRPHPAVDQVYALLRQLLRITVNDGRVFIGTFAGTDKPLNIILVNAEEFRIGPGQNPDGRFVGQIMLPWKVIVKVEACAPEPKQNRGGGMYIWQVERYSGVLFELTFVDYFASSMNLEDYLQMHGAMSIDSLDTSKSCLEIAVPGLQRHDKSTWSFILFAPPDRLHLFFRPVRQHAL